MKQVKPAPAKRRKPSLLRFQAALLACSVLSMALSYAIVRYMDRQSPPAVAMAPEDTAIREAEQLRRYTNELIRLTGTYLGRLPQGAPASSAAFTSWAEQEFRPQVNDLRQRITGSGSTHPLLSPLLEAADQTAAMAARPADTGRRRAALAAVRHAAEAVEGHIARIHANPYINEPAQVIGF